MHQHRCVPGDESYGRPSHEGKPRGDIVQMQICIGVIFPAQRQQMLFLSMAKPPRERV